MSVSLLKEKAIFVALHFQNVLPTFYYWQQESAICFILSSKSVNVHIL